MNMRIAGIVIAISLMLLGSSFLLFKKQESPPQTLLFDEEKAANATTDASTGNKEQEKKFHPDSLPALAEKEFTGNNLKLGNILSETDTYTRYYITYQSEGITISGIMNVPRGDGPFPVLILNHGYIDPDIYTNGRGLKREQDYFARRGYVVAHSDYRGHADSDPDPYQGIRPRTGYTEDVINLISAIKKSDLLFVDKNKIGMLGHSMGGGIALNVMVAKPDLVKAFVLFAPINATYRKNFERWVPSEWPELPQKIFDYYGSFEENPQFWESVSARTYFSRISAPALLHQGTADKDVPLEWSQGLARDLKQAGKEIIYYEYPGEPHEFIDAWPTVMQRSAKFFNEYLKKGA